MTTERIIQRLEEERCIVTCCYGSLVQIFPQWFTWELLQQAIKDGALRQDLYDTGLGWDGPLIVT